MVLSDLAEFVNFVTRVKIVPATADNVAFGETERVRARDFASKLSMRVLSRMWQMLLKGITEVQAATRPAAAAEMVLVRIAYVADLPTPDEAIRMIEQNGGASVFCRIEFRVGACIVHVVRIGGVLDAGFGPARDFRAARQRRVIRAPADDGADRGSAGRARGAQDIDLSRTGGAGRREARPLDQRPRWKPMSGWSASRTAGSNWRWSAARRAP